MSVNPGFRQSLGYIKRQIISRYDKKMIEQLRESPLFDSEFYLSKYTDVAESGLDPVEHYISFGRFRKLGIRLPGPWASVFILNKLQADNSNWLKRALDEKLTPEDLLKKFSDIDQDEINVLLRSHFSDVTKYDEAKKDFEFIIENNLFDFNYVREQTGTEEVDYYNAIMTYLSRDRFESVSPKLWVRHDQLSNEGSFKDAVLRFLNDLALGIKPEDVLSKIHYIELFADQKKTISLRDVFNKKKQILDSGQFDLDFYVKSVGLTETNPDVILHYILLGEDLNYMPNEWFIPTSDLVAEFHKAQSSEGEETSVKLLSFLAGVDRTVENIAIEAPSFDKVFLKAIVLQIAKTLPKSSEGLFKLVRDYLAIHNSQKFDSKFYVDTYSEYLGGFKLYPLVHYVVYGALNGALPNKNINPNDLITSSKNLETDPNPFYKLLRDDDERKQLIETVFGDELDTSDNLFLLLVDENFPNLNSTQYSNLIQDYKILKFSETLDEKLYLELNPDIESTGLLPLHHFLFHGAEQGRWPCEWYDINEGYKNNPAFKQLKKNPFANYIRDNPIITRNIKTQSLKFKGAVVDLKDEIIASGLFDEAYYKKILNIKDEKFDAIEHYLKFGRIYKMTPRSDFDPEWYWNTYSDCQEMELDPFVHYVRIGHEEGRSTKSSSLNTEMEDETGSHAGRIQSLLPGARSPAFEEKRATQGEAAVRCFTWYLPQFHPCDLNDEFWGEGFTEWTNVTTALPKFTDHIQPKLPSDFGFYDLRLTDVMKKQAKLAKEFHIEGFAFYYYWFGGTRVLERPIENFLKTPDIDIDFFLCWANENWTRRWDGRDQDVLLAQNHSEKDDKNIIEDWKRHIDDPRYTKVKGKPLIAIYRPDLIPNMKTTITRWRKHAKKLGMGELYFAAVNSFNYKEGKADGFDAWIEFPPHSFTNLKNVTMEKDIPETFSGAIYDYDSYVEENDTKTAADDLPVFRGAMPSWDNTARKKDKATIFSGATPGKFQSVVKRQIEKIKEQNKGDEQILIVNAWNEWAEGTYMEPDRANGYAKINALGRALTHVSQKYAIISSRAEKKDFKSISKHYPIDILRPQPNEAGGIGDLIDQLCYYGKSLLSYDMVIFEQDEKAKFSNIVKKKTKPLIAALDHISADTSLGYGSFSKTELGYSVLDEVPDFPQHVMFEFLSLMGLKSQPESKDYRQVKGPIYLRTSALRAILENADGIKEVWLEDPKRQEMFSLLLLYCIDSWGFKSSNIDMNSISS